MAVTKVTTAKTGGADIAFTVTIPIGTVTSDVNTKIADSISGRRASSALRHRPQTSLHGHTRQTRPSMPVLRSPVVSVKNGRIAAWRLLEHSFAADLKHLQHNIVTAENEEEGGKDHDMWRRVSNNGTNSSSGGSFMNFAAELTTQLQSSGMDVPSGIQVSFIMYVTSGFVVRCSICSICSMCHVSSVSGAPLRCPQMLTL